MDHPGSMSLKLIELDRTTIEAELRVYQQSNISRLQDLHQRLLRLPAEIRESIISHVFGKSTIHVTTSSLVHKSKGEYSKGEYQDCRTPTNLSGPYSSAHKWLLKPGNPLIQREAWQFFLRNTTWVFHCEVAYRVFLKRLRFIERDGMECLNHVRHMEMWLRRTDYSRLTKFAGPNAAEPDNPPTQTPPKIPSWIGTLRYLPRLQDLRLEMWDMYDDRTPIDLLPQVTPEFEERSGSARSKLMKYVRDMVDSLGCEYVQRLIDQDRSFELVLTLPMLRTHDSNPADFVIETWSFNIDKKTMKRVIDPQLFYEHYFQTLLLFEDPSWAQAFHQCSGHIRDSIVPN